MGRLLRVFRVIRVVRIFKALRKLVASLVDTTKSLIWAMFLLGLIIYIFSILFTDIVLDFLEENLNNTSADADVQDNLQWYFGNIYTSGETLFRSLLCGFSWIHAADALWPVGTFWVQLFHFYMAFCTLAVMNVITGVFCNSAIKAAERDHDMVVQALLQNRQEFKTLVSDLFGYEWRLHDQCGGVHGEMLSTPGPCALCRPLWPQTTASTLARADAQGGDVAISTRRTREDHGRP